MRETVGVACGKCGGRVYMETCRMSRPTTHDWVIATECQRCGERSDGIVCPAIGIDLDSRSGDLARERVGMFLEIQEGAA